jgi:hypothetical protein
VYRHELLVRLTDNQISPRLQAAIDDEMEHGHCETQYEISTLNKTRRRPISAYQPSSPNAPLTRRLRPAYAISTSPLIQTPISGSLKDRFKEKKTLSTSRVRHRG